MPVTEPASGRAERRAVSCSLSRPAVGASRIPAEEPAGGRRHPPRRAMPSARHGSRPSLSPGGPHAVVCSTDDPEIAACARDWGAEVPFERPASLATADTTSVDVAVHALDTLAAAGRTFRAARARPAHVPADGSGDLVAAVARFDARSRPRAAGIRHADAPGGVARGRVPRARSSRSGTRDLPTTS